MKKIHAVFFPRRKSGQALLALLEEGVDIVIAEVSEFLIIYVRFGDERLRTTLKSLHVEENKRFNLISAEGGSPAFDIVVTGESLEMVLEKLRQKYEVELDDRSE